METRLRVIGYGQALARIVDDGIAAAERDYTGDRLDGARAGFEACRDKTPAQLTILLARTRSDGRTTWYHRCYLAEVEWVCNVVSAILANQGEPPIVPPTARGVVKAAEIVGVGPSPGPLSGLS